MPELHLPPLTPKGGEVINVLVVYRTALLKDDACVLQVAVLLVELCKGGPERVRLADRLFCQPKQKVRRRTAAGGKAQPGCTTCTRTRLFSVHCLDCLGVGQDLLRRLPAKQLHALVPLVHVVRVLPQHHAAEQLRAPLREPLEAFQPARHKRGSVGSVTGLPLGLVVGWVSQGRGGNGLEAERLEGEPEVEVLPVILEQKVEAVVLGVGSLVLLCLRLVLHLGRDERLLKLSQGVKDHGEVTDGNDRRHPFLVDVPRLLEEAPADVVVRQGAPEPPDLSRPPHGFQGTRIPTLHRERER